MERSIGDNSKAIFSTPLDVLNKVVFGEAVIDSPKIVEVPSWIAEPTLSLLAPKFEFVWVFPDSFLNAIANWLSWVNAMSYIFYNPVIVILVILPAHWLLACSLITK